MTPSSSKRNMSLYLIVAIAASLPLIPSSFTSTSLPRVTATIHRKAYALTLMKHHHEHADLKNTLEKDTSEFVSPPLSRSRSSFPSPLSMICDDRKEFELNLGKAIDTLRKDYPTMLTERPNFEIYTDDLEVIDPTGFKLHGLTKYKAFFRVLRSIIAFVYCPESSGLTFRLIYDWARSTIRVSWNAVLIPKSIYGGLRNKVHVDGISVYEVDRATGMVTQHRVEHLLLNDKPVAAPKGIFHAVEQEVANPQGIPALNMGGFGGEPMKSKSEHPVRPTTSLKMSTTSEDTGSSTFDWEAFEKKNAYRKKFGLKPITPEEFEELEAQVQLLSQQTQQKQEALQSAAELTEKKKNNLFSKLLGDVIPDSCESNYDCERPEVCCDFIFKKVCCASGVGVMNIIPGEKYQPIPQRVIAGRGEHDDFHY